MFFRKKLYKPGLHDIGVEPELKNWVMVTIENPDIGSVVIRVRTSRPDMPDIGKYNTCVEIKWDYSLQSAGMPNEAVTRRYKAFEDRVDELFWYNNLAFNVKIITGLGERLWIVYTKSYDEFMKVFNEKLADSPAFPLKISYCGDPTWEIWKEGLQDIVR